MTSDSTAPHSATRPAAGLALVAAVLVTVLGFALSAGPNDLAEFVGEMGLLAIGLVVAFVVLGEARARGRRYRLAVAAAFAASFLLVWVSLGVGVIGADGDPANVAYVGVLALGTIGAFVVRFEPVGMARVLFGMAAAVAIVGTVAVFAGLGRPWSGPLELVLLNGFFAALFVGAGGLYRRAA